VEIVSKENALLLDCGRGPPVRAQRFSLWISLHITVKDEADLRVLRTFLDGRGVQLPELTTIVPSLEDVFSGLVKTAGARSRSRDEPAPHVGTIAVKEYVQFFRESAHVVATILMPLIQVILYGYLSSDVRYQADGGMDLSQTTESRQLLLAFHELTVFLDYLSRPKHARCREPDRRRSGAGGNRHSARLRPSCCTGKSRLKSWSPWMHRMQRRRVRASRSRKRSAASVSGGLVVKAAPDERRADSKNRVDVPHPGLVQSALRQEVFIVPGVLALVMQFTMTFLSMSTIVRERELGRWSNSSSVRFSRGN